MEDEVIEMHDFVSVEGQLGTWETVGSRTSEPIWEVQLGRDAATKHWENSANLTLVRKASKPTAEPGFYPARGIMD
jgi:hypothetical protein